MGKALGPDPYPGRGRGEDAQSAERAADRGKSESGAREGKVGEPFEVWDYRDDVRNVVVTPEIRGRFLRMEPGEVGPFHSHDLGQELFIVLEGRAEFEIEGRRRTLGPGQACFARAGELHEVRTVGEEAMTLFLAVTPHLEPTHTFWEEGRRLPPVYGYWTPAGLAAQEWPTASLADLAERHLHAVGRAREALAAQEEALAAEIERLRESAGEGDPGGSKAAVDAMETGMRQSGERFVALMAAWNDLALRMGRLAGGEG